MRYFIDLCESVIRDDVNGKPIIILKNPNMQQIINLLYKTEKIKGLLIDHNLYFWDSYSATHGHIAEKYWTKIPGKAYWESQEYIDSRIIIELDDIYCKGQHLNNVPTIAMDDEFIKIPEIANLLKSDEIYFRALGRGWMNYSDYLSEIK